MFANTAASSFILTALLCYAHSSEIKCTSDLRPKITARTSSIESTPSFTGVNLYCLYGEAITLSCTANGTDNLRIRGGNLPTIQFNSTAQVTTQPYVGDYDYTCIDGKTNCEDTLTVRVRPLMGITSPRLHYSLDEYGEKEYFVSHGDTYEIFCTGKEFLHLRNSYYSLILTEVFNATTVRYKAQANQIGKQNVYCTTGGEQSNWLQLKVDFHPEGQQFQCVCHQWSKLECWWTSLSKLNRFELFYHNQTDKNACDVTGTSAVCASNNSSLFEHPITLSLQTCNQVFCDNQSFVINPNLIRKLYPPSVFEVKTRRSGVVGWNRPVADDGYLNCEYKVEYRQQAMQWRLVNTSYVRCDKYCELQLSLPCLNTLYEIRVFVRLTEAPIEDRYFSEPGTLHIFTDPDTITKPIDQIIDSEMYLCELGTLKQHAVAEITAINKIRNTWKEKLEKIKKHIDYFKAIDEARRLLFVP